MAPPGNLITRPAQRSLERFGPELSRLVAALKESFPFYKSPGRGEARLPGLMPKLGAGMSDTEKATLRSAVTAIDRQIDPRVYELHDLAPEETQRVVDGQ